MYKKNKSDRKDILKRSAVKKQRFQMTTRALLVMLFILVFGIQGISVNAALDLSDRGTVTAILKSGTEKTKSGGTLTWKWVSGNWDGETDPRWALLIEGKGATLNYITTVFCDGETQTPWYANASMCSGVAYAFVDEGITSLGNSFFAGLSNLMEVELPESLTSIGDSAFALCSHLRKINIPKSVTSISSNAFYRAKSELTIYCESDSYAHRYAQEQGIHVYLTDQSICENKGHKKGAPATCETPQLCSVCKETLTPALGHEYTKATCEEPAKCTRCKKPTGTALGHNWGEWEINSYIQKEQRICSNCSKVETRETVKVNSVSVLGTSKKLLVGKTLKLTADVLPLNAANTKVVWSVNQPKYASVSPDGVVKAKAAGAGKTVVITAKAADGSGEKDTFQIKIKGAVKKIRLKAAKKTVKAGKTIQIKSTVKVGAGGSKALKWTSSNTAYASVNAKGRVTAKKAGKGRTVKITATAKDGSGKKASITIKIK